MKNYNDAVNQIYAEKEQQIILGLTGRTGAGCSTAAGILKKQFDDLELEYYVDQSENIKEKKAFEIIKEYIASDNRCYHVYIRTDRQMHKRNRKKGQTNAGSSTYINYKRGKKECV